MIKIENVEVMGWEQAIRGMRNPMNSLDKSDSGICKGGDDGIGCNNCAKQISCVHTYDHSFQLGKNDYELMMKLATGGSVHAKYWWNEFDTYKVGTVANSCSTMHKIHEKEFALDDFSHEHLVTIVKKDIKKTIDTLNMVRETYIDGGYFQDLDGNTIKVEPKNKEVWWQMIQLLPSSYNQKRTVMLDYEVLAGIYPMRKDHKLDEWCEHKESTCTMNSVGDCKNQKEYLLCEDCSVGKGFCDWIKTLPYSEIITGDYKREEK